MVWLQIIPDQLQPEIERSSNLPLRPDPELRPNQIPKHMPVSGAPVMAGASVITEASAFTEAPQLIIGQYEHLYEAIGVGFRGQTRSASHHPTVN